MLEAVLIGVTEISICRLLLREQQAREESMENQGSSQAPDTIASGDVGVSLSAPQDKDAGAAAIPSTTSDVNISTPTVATNSAAVVGQTRMFGVKQPVLIKPETQTSVFGDDDDDVVVVKKRKLEKIKYTDEQLRAVGIDPEAERRKRMKDLVASLPVSRGAIFEYKVNWALLDTSIMEGRIRYAESILFNFFYSSTYFFQLKTSRTNASKCSHLDLGYARRLSNLWVKKSHM